MDGKQLQKTISAPSLSGTIPVVIEYFILFGIGVIAIILHVRFKSPLNIPGHHGLEFMALMMAGRAASKIPWASSISSMGIGLFLLLPFFGFNDPFMGINYMLPGLMIDLLYSMTRQDKWQLIVLALISGAAYATIPISRLILHLLTGYPYGTIIKYGHLIPIIGFFAFGLAGGFFGAGITTSLLKKLTRK